MNNSIHLDKRASVVLAVVAAVVFLIVFLQSGSAQPANSKPWPGTGAAAGDLPPGPLSLAQVKEIAFERNWDLLTAKSGIDAASAQLIVAKEFPNPTASLSIANFATHNIATIEGNGIWQRSYDTIAAVSQLIEIGGKRHDRQAAARAGIKGAKARFYDAKRTLDQGVTKAYIAALLAENNVQILNESSHLLRHEADIADSRFKAGDISDSDKNQIEINAEQYDLQAKSAEATAVQARIAVEILMGVPTPQGNYVSAGSLEALAQDPLPPAQASAL